MTEQPYKEGPPPEDARPRNKTLRGRPRRGKLPPWERYLWHCIDNPDKWWRWGFPLLAGQTARNCASTIRLGLKRPKVQTGEFGSKGTWEAEWGIDKDQFGDAAWFVWTRFRVKAEPMPGGGRRPEGGLRVKGVKSNVREVHHRKYGSKHDAGKPTGKPTKRSDR